MEAALIYELERGRTNIAHNINRVKSCDYGGEGPRAAAEAHEERFVYIAVKPITSRFSAGGRHIGCNSPRPRQLVSGLNICSDITGAMVCI